MESNGDPLLVRVLMRVIQLVAWLREQWLLWLMLCTIFAGYALPVGVALSATPTVATVCTAVSFFLTGLTLPVGDVKSLSRHSSAVSLVLFHCFLVAPLLGWAVVYAMPSVAPGGSGMQLLATGLLCVTWMPTPMLVSTISTVAAGGSEGFSQALSLVANLLGLALLSPVGTQFAMRHGSGALLMPSTDDALPMYAWVLSLTTLLPLVLGHVVQHFFTSSSLKSLVLSDEHLKRQWTSANVTCSEVCDTSHANWRTRARQCSVATLLLLNYVIFSGMFRPEAPAVTLSKSGSGQESLGNGTPSAPSLLSDHGQRALSTPPHHEGDVTWFSIAIIVAAVLLMQAAQLLGAWMTTSLLSGIAPEERIAVLFLCFQKSELLAVPLVVQACSCLASNPRAAGLLVLPSVLVHCTQSILCGVVTPALRSWRNRQHCRPGTSLLPLRYTKAPKHGVPSSAATTVGGTPAATLVNSQGVVSPALSNFQPGA